MAWINGFFMLSLGLGVAAVLQGGLNEQLADRWNFPAVVVLNNVVLLLVSALFYFWIRFWPELFPKALQVQKGLPSFEWWYVFPGILGFALVFGIPFAIAYIGAFEVFIGLIAAQLAGSLLWDYWIEGLSIHPVRIAGAVLGLLGAYLVNRFPTS